MTASPITRFTEPPSVRELGRATLQAPGQGGAGPASMFPGVCVQEIISGPADFFNVGNLL